jgi:hypothetical protein
VAARFCTANAERLSGVKAVWTTDAKQVRFAGQDIAAVAAVSQEIAEDVLCSLDMCQPGRTCFEAR